MELTIQPYFFTVADRADGYSIPHNYSDWFVPAISIGNFIGRVSSGTTTAVIFFFFPAYVPYDAICLFIYYRCNWLFTFKCSTSMLPDRIFNNFRWNYYHHRIFCFTGRSIFSIVLLRSVGIYHWLVFHMCFGYDITSITHKFHFSIQCYVASDRYRVSIGSGKIDKWIWTKYDDNGIFWINCTTNRNNN